MSKIDGGRRRFGPLVLEGVVIVASILLAFGIDAWWDGRMEAVERSALIESLILDFETTRAGLDKSILRGDSVVAKGEGLLHLVQQDTPVPLDSLQSLMQGFTSAVEFEPATSSYDAAVGAGTLSTIGSADFLRSAAEYRRALNFYQVSFDVSGELFYFGPQARMRRELGSLGVLERDPDDCLDDYNCPYPRAFALSGPELFAYLGRKDIYGGLENIQNTSQNVVRSLKEARVAVDEVLRALTAAAR